MMTWGRQLSKLDGALRDRRSSHRQNNSSSASPQTHNTDKTHADWHTEDTAVVPGLNSKNWQLPTNVRDRMSKTTTHSQLLCQSVIFLNLWVYRSCPRSDKLLGCSHSVLHDKYYTWWPSSYITHGYISVTGCYLFKYSFLWASSCLSNNSLLL